MDDFLWDIHAIEGMMLYALEQVELWDDAYIINTFFESINLLPSPLLLDMGQGIFKYAQQYFCTI